MIICVGANLQGQVHKSETKTRYTTSIGYRRMENIRRVSGGYQASIRHPDIWFSTAYTCTHAHTHDFHKYGEITSTNMQSEHKETTAPFHILLEV